VLSALKLSGTIKENEDGIGKRNHSGHGGRRIVDPLKRKKKESQEVEEARHGLGSRGGDQKGYEYSA